jgi:hypothetical protein
MSIFEIPELLEHVRKYLSHNELVTCVRVNKTWYSLLAPFIWRSIPSRRSFAPTVSDFRGHDFFRRLVRDDYLATYHTPRAEGLSVLSRCGPWIRELALFRIQLRCPPLQQEQEPEQDQLSPSGSQNVIPEPSEQELLLHLLKHCPSLKSLTLARWRADEQDMVFWRTLSTDIVPRLKEFEALDVYGERSEELRLVFNHCPPKIQKLKFSLSHSFYSADSDEQHEGEEDARDGDVEIEDPLVELKDLDVSALGPDRDWSAWSAFLRRSVCLESLTVGSIDRWWSQALAKCVRLRRLHIQGCSMKTLGVLASILKNGGLSNLDDIVLRFSRFMSSQVNDQGLADMLSACRKGWRSVDVSVLYPRSADVLIKNHHRTLECLYAEETSSLTSARLYQFLLLCPNLHTFSILEDGAKALPATPARFEADEFIDLDQVTNTLRPWPCESTLRVFRAKIARIPRPDVTHTYHGFPRDEDNYQYDEFDEEVRLEEYPGQGRDIQHRVYERLSRFKQLEVLALGHNDRDTLSFSRESNYHPDVQGVDVYFDEMFQYECLSMNLQRSGGGSSGMELLAELKDLRELNVHRMATCIGVEEVRWMTQNWPKLRSVRGLKSEHEEERRADNWLKVNCPWIESEPCSFLRPG